MNPFEEAVPCRSYRLGHMVLYLRLLLSGAASLRCVSRIQAITFEFFIFVLGVPHGLVAACGCCGWGTLSLQDPSSRGADWVWIIDHTVQIGAEKLFFVMIMCLRLSSLPPAGECLKHEDLEPIGFYPVTHSSAAVVLEQLQEAAKAAGVPRQIISDHGTDIAKGVEQFCREHPRSCSVYDIKHKSAVLLKRKLNADPLWLSFSQGCAQAARRMRQTVPAHLCPPNQRSKSRYM